MMEITNLQQYKDYLNDYINSGEYHKECTIVTNYAKNIVDKGPVKNPCICLDCDDTAITLIPLAMKNDWGYPYDLLIYTWEAINIPALDPVLSFYTYAMSKGFKAFVISSRSTEYQKPTEECLKNAGYYNLEQVILKDPKDKRTTPEFKTAMRAGIIAQGYDIVINIGDEPGDLQGNADYQCKLPNKFYE